MLRHITGLMLLLASSSVFSQNIQTSTVEWNCASTFTASSGTFADEISKVVSNPQQITWYDAEGVARQTFAVTSANGSWTNVASNGSIQFIVSSGANRGTVQFERSAGATTIKILIISEAETEVYELSVNTVTPL